MKIDKNNYEIFIIDYFDNKLSPERTDELKIFLSLNPDLDADLDDPGFFPISSDDITFDYKDNLKEIPFKSIIIGDVTFDIYSSSHLLRQE